jgi:hypothetical protein
MPGTSWRALAIGLLTLAAVAPAAGADRADRLDRFRELATGRLGLAQLAESDAPAETYRDLYALLDDEIVENLLTGGPFASWEFLQDRLDTFADAWGGATLTLVRVGAVLVGAFTLDEAAGASSVRVYGRVRGEPALLTAFHHEGRPGVYVPPAADGAAMVVSWEGAASGWGTRPLRVELLRREGDRVRVAWSTGDLFPDGLLARSWSLRGADLRVRYELRYPGWAPGCEGQTEQEDVYRLTPAGGARLSRRALDGWHRELHAAVSRLTAALAARDAAAVAALVPDRALRARLPAGLRAEPACDAREAAAVSVAAAADDGRPWTLTFRRLAAGWRLTAATPVLQ